MAQNEPQRKETPPGPSPNSTSLLFQYQCRSGKFIRLANRIESKKIDSVARIESNRNFLARIGMLYWRFWGNELNDRHARMNVGKPEAAWEKWVRKVMFAILKSMRCLIGSQWSCWRRVRGLHDWGEQVTTGAMRFCAFWSLEMFFWVAPNRLA